MIHRLHLMKLLRQALSESPVAVLLGARQVGKTTLARQLRSTWKEVHFFDLETSQGRNALSTPELALSSLGGLVVIDEVQRMPSLFATLRPLADREPSPAHFLLLGSASPFLMRGVSESLAGRAQFVTIPGFSLQEVGVENQDHLWLRGGFPRSFLATSDAASLRWRESFITTFLEMDIPQLGIRVPSETLRRFWIMLCHLHGQIWNGSELARSLGTSEKTARHYLDILTGTYVTRVLAPWHNNLGKRLVKSPKMYIRDSGLLHGLLGIENMSQLRSHPKYGASWEGFAMEQVLSQWDERRAFFWATHQGAELDLMIESSGKRYGFEFKCSDAPILTKSMQIAFQDLQLKQLWVIYPGSRSYPLRKGIDAVSISQIPTP